MARIWEDCATVAYRILNTRVHVFLSLFKLIVFRTYKDIQTFATFGTLVLVTLCSDDAIILIELETELKKHKIYAFYFRRGSDYNSSDILKTF